MASNMAVWRRNLDGAPGPLIVRGLVQAASTSAFKMGEILNYNETSTYWDTIDAAADITYLLGFANSEIDTENTPAARYADIIVPRPADVFEIPLAAAAAIEMGANYVPTGTTQQQATSDVDGYPVFNSVGMGNYPEPIKNGGTTVRSQANGLFTVNYEYSYYKKLVFYPGVFRKQIVLSAATTLLEEWSGATILVDTAAVLELPQNARRGTWFKVVPIADVNVDVHSTGGGVYVKGAKQADSKYIRIADIADFLVLECVGSNDWVATESISGADGDITVET